MSSFSSHLSWKHNVSADDSQMVSTVQSWMRINRWWTLQWVPNWNAHYWEQKSSRKFDFKQLSSYSSWTENCNWVSKMSNLPVYSWTQFSKDVCRRRSSNKKKNQHAWDLHTYHHNSSIKQRIVTRDKTWIHYMLITTKKESLKWKHKGSRATKKFKVTSSVGKVMGTFFWSHKPLIHIEYIPKGTTITAGAHCDTNETSKINQNEKTWSSHVWSNPSAR